MTPAVGTLRAISQCAALPILAPLRTGPSRAEIATAAYFAGLAPPCGMVQSRLTQVDRGEARRFARSYALSAPTPLINRYTPLRTFASSIL